MSSDNRERLLSEVDDGGRTLQSAVDALDQAVADHLGVNRTDLRCLDELMRTGPTGPAQLAARLGLTTGSTTTLLDRLERAGYIERIADPVDRRRLVIHPTERIQQEAAQLYGPLAADGGEAMSRFTTRELAVIARYLTLSRELQQRHLTRIRHLEPGI